MNGDDIKMDKKIKEIKTMNDLNKSIINLLFDLYYNERHEWVSDNEILFFINKSETNVHWKHVEIALKSKKMFHDIKNILEESNVFNTENINIELYNSINNYDYFGITADKNNSDEYISFTLKFKFPDFLNYKKISDILIAIESSIETGLIKQSETKNILNTFIDNIISGKYNNTNSNL